MQIINEDNTLYHLCYPCTYPCLKIMKKQSLKYPSEKEIAQEFITAKFGSDKTPHPQFIKELKKIKEPNKTKDEINDYFLKK